MNSWLVRPNPIQKRRMEEFLHGDLIAIGWPRLPDLTGQNKEKIKSLLLQFYSDAYVPNSTSLGNITTVIDSFANRMNVNDYIVVPDGDDIHIGKVAGEYYYDASKANEIDGYPHQRKAEWILVISREQIPVELRASLRAQMTIVRLSQRQHLIEQIVGVKPLLEPSVPEKMLDIENLMADALRTLHQELQSEDADRRLKAAVEIIRLKREGLVE